MATTPLGLSEKQQQIRLSGVGASEVFDVLNGGIATYARKVGDAEPFEGNTLTEFGHRIERVIGEAWAERHPGLRLYTPGTLRHPEHEWALASPDRVVATPGHGRPARADWLSLLEIKTVFFAGREFGEGADEIPERYLVQVAWQHEVADIEDATLVALVNGDYREYPIARDRELGGMLLDVVGRFWRDNVLARVPPPVDGSAAYTAFLRRRHPEDAAPPLPATPALRDLVAKLNEAKEAAKKAKEAESLAGNLLRAALGDATGIEGLCSYRMQKGSSYTVTREPGRVLRLAKEK
jgi:predicted phage-related endonuclease